MHFTETCDDELLRLASQVETTPAGVPDNQIVSRVQADLAQKGLLLQYHLVEADDVNPTTLLGSQADHGVDLIAPTMQKHWCQEQTGYDLIHFHVDWTAQSVCCPQGHISASWTPALDAQGRSAIKVTSSSRGCKACPSRRLCAGQTCRGLTLQPRERMQAFVQSLVDAHQRERTAVFHEVYRHQAGIEGPQAQGNRTMGLLRPRYVG